MKERVFVTGISGFAGSHMAELLVTRGFDVYGSVYGPVEPPDGIPPSNLYRLDLLDLEATIRVFREVQPNLIINLAAYMVSPALSQKDPAGTKSKNLLMGENVLKSAKICSDLGKVVIVESSEVYGRVKPEDIPINEDTSLNPLGPYGESKVALDSLAKDYFTDFNLPIVRLRPFNHIGTRQPKGFVVPDFASQIVKIETGIMKPVLKVGNLETIRDFTAVEDMVQAYLAAMLQGQNGEVYNLGSGAGVVIGELLNQLLTLSSVKINVEQDQALMNPSAVPVSICDAGKFKKLTGWEPKIPLIDTLKRILEYWRKQ